LKPASKKTQGSAKGSASTGNKSKGFTDEEHAAMRERVKEMRAESAGKGDGESLVQEKIAGMKEPDRSMAKRVHAIIMATAPGLVPRLWYGMPAYSKEDKVVCFFMDSAKFKSRYATLSFSDKAKLDDGSMWPVTYALKELTPGEEAKIAALVKRAVS
jgi:hypothetical protein